MAESVEPKVSFDSFIVGLAASLTTGLVLLAIQHKVNEGVEYYEDDTEQEQLKE